MTEEGYSKLRFVAISALTITFLFLFYTLGATRVLEFFPKPRLALGSPQPSGEDGTGAAVPIAIDLNQGLDMLMIWAGTAVGIMGLCAVIFAFAIFRVSELGGWMKRYSIVWIAILTLAAAIVLLISGNVIADRAIEPQCALPNAAGSLCDYHAGKDQASEILGKNGWQFLRDHNKEGSYAVAVTRLKYTLNFFFQTAAIGVLSLMVILSTARRIFGFIDESRIREAYLISALLLSLVIVSDALFFDFLRETIQGQDTSGYTALHRGLLFYFAIVSTATLALALSICSIIGKVPLMLSGIREGAGPDAAMIDRVKTFFLNPGFATAFATFAPLLSAMITPAAL